MYIAPKCITAATLPPEELKADKQAAESYEECGVGRKAVYLGAFGLSRVRYAPLSAVERVYKRLAVSKGAFEANKVFGSLAYLVLMIEGKEIVVRFTHEENVDAMLSAFRRLTKVPVGKK